MTSETTIQHKQLLFENNLERQCDKLVLEEEEGDRKGIWCPHCGSNGNLRVLETRPVRSGVRRRRNCFDCSHRWTTYEYSATSKENLLAQRRKLTKLIKVISDANETLTETLEIIDNLILEDE
jgi:hypothetical protein